MIEFYVHLLKSDLKGGGEDPPCTNCSSCLCVAIRLYLKYINRMLHLSLHSESEQSELAELNKCCGRRAP